jgi:hypothetical protein
MSPRRSVQVCPTSASASTSSVDLHTGGDPAPTQQGQEAGVSWRLWRGVHGVRRRIHFCLGARLAGVELTIALERLFTRFPNLHLAIPRSQIRFAPRSGTRALVALPVQADGGEQVGVEGVLPILVIPGDGPELLRRDCPAQESAPRSLHGAPHPRGITASEGSPRAPQTIDRDVGVADRWW